MNYYTLDENNNPIRIEGTPHEQMMAFGMLMEDEKFRRVGVDIINGYRISTIFLVLDHGFYLCNEKPILWETMIFAGNDCSDLFCQRYDNYLDAKRGHNICVEIIKNVGFSCNTDLKVCLERVLENTSLK